MKNNITIKHISEKDYFSACTCIINSLKESFGAIYPKKLVKEFCDKYEPDKFSQKAKEVNYFIALDSESEDRVVGIIGLKNNHLRTFFVDPLYQGKGVGRMLYDFLEAEARKANVEKLILEGSPLGEPVYKHFGFIKIKTIHKEKIGIPYTDALMEKTLE